MVPALYRWVAPVLAVVAVFLLPALRVTVPLLPSSEWTIAGLGAQIGRSAAAPSNGQPALRERLRQMEDVRRELAGPAARPDHGLEVALALAALIPLTALLAGLCALASLGLAPARWRRWRLTVAWTGVFSTGYAIAASEWLTHVVHAQLAQWWTRAQHGLGGLLQSLHLQTTAAQWINQVRLDPEIGLYLLCLVFLAMLLAPETTKTPPPVN